MKKIITSVIVFVSATAFGQETKIIDPETITHTMDSTAAFLLKDAKAISVSIAVVKDGKAYTKHYGEIEKGNGNPANNNIHFEIASVSKVFAGTLIANAVLEGKINLEDDIRKYLTGNYPNLEYQGKPIKIKDLLSHKTGIFRQFPDYGDILKEPSDIRVPKIKKLDEDYSKDLFFNELKTVKLDTLPGTVYRYSSLGPELCAAILENMYQKSYDALLHEVILDKLDMRYTKFKLAKDEYLLKGYNENDMIMPALSSNLWGAAGLLKSTMTDLVKFLNYELNEKDPVVKESHRELTQGNDGLMGYFWDIQKDSDGNFCYWKHGGAFGTQNLFIVYPAYKLGISIVINKSAANTFSYLAEAQHVLADSLKPFGKRSIRFAIKNKCMQDIDDGIAYYHTLKKNKATDYNFSDENELNTLGYYFLKTGKTQAAFKIFNLNVSEFPSSSNAYDSRGEAYFEKKQYQLSKKDYEKSLKLNPGNTNAKDYLLKIKAAMAQ